MAEEIKVKVTTMGGEEKEIETPTDIKADDFIKELVIALNLPLMDAEGHQVSWRIDDKDTGKTLDGNQTLDVNGVKDGHRLSLIRATVAGTKAKALVN
jgi:uncharacterized ubiquitin-like protein YukD